MKRIAAVLSLLALAACGADGEPQPPRVNGTVTLSNNGVSAGTSVTMGRGPVWLGLGLAL